MKIALITAALDSFHPPVHSRQDLEFDFYCSTDAPRGQNLSARLQARIPKMFGWQIYPGYDFYVWLDAAFSLCLPGALSWFVGRLGQHDLALFDHPERHSVREEAEFIRYQINKGNRYLTRRYLGEDVDGHLTLLDTLGYRDDRLYATGALIYRPTSDIQSVMWKWWAYTSRYHAVDQLSLPVALWESGVPAAQLPGDIFTCPYFSYTSHR